MTSRCAAKILDKPRALFRINLGMVAADKVIIDADIRVVHASDAERAHKAHSSLVIRPMGEKRSNWCGRKEDRHIGIIMASGLLQATTYFRLLPLSF